MPHTSDLSHSAADLAATLGVTVDQLQRSVEPPELRRHLRGGEAFEVEAAWSWAQVLRMCLARAVDASRSPVLRRLSKAEALEGRVQREAQLDQVWLLGKGP